MQNEPLSLLAKGNGMRIIGGKYKGKALHPPKDLKVRPTLGRLREAVFNICQSNIEEASFLDLFAGTGAMGLEAASRGASHVTFVEKDRSAVACLRQNVKALGIGEKITIYSKDALRTLERFAKQGTAFDIVYVDPPYFEKTVSSLLYEEQVLDFFDTHPLLAKGGSLFLESSSTRKLSEHSYQQLSLSSQRKVSTTILYHFSM